MPIRVVGRSEDARIELGVWKAILNGNRVGGIEQRLILVIPLPELVTVAARIAYFQHPILAELALDVKVVFQRIRRPVVGVHREGRWKSLDFVQAGEERVDKNVRDLTVADQSEIGVEGRDQPRELQLVQVDVVIEGAEPGANDRLVSKRTPGQPDARGEVILVRLNDSGRDQSLFGVVEA